MKRDSASRFAPLAVIAAWILTVSCASERSVFPEVEGWMQVGEPRVFTAETLWEYIDGAAVMFVEYGVRTCTAADLSDGRVAATVELYEMDSPLAAVGVFRTESPGGGEPLGGATLATVSPPTQALMVKGNTYVKVNVYEGELTDAEARRLLHGLAGSLPGETAMPREFSLLPEAARVAGSERYEPVSLLSLEELTECVTAVYQGRAGDTWQGFVVLPSASSRVWQALSDRWGSFEHDGHTVRFREVPYTGLVGVTRTETGMYGVTGAADETQLRSRIEEFAGLH
jgi:hypothetical protein